MIIKLFQPSTRNWLLIAEGLNDPPSWDRFLPCHTVASERWLFDSTVKKLAAGKLKFKPCKELLRSGTSVIEYDWEIAEEDILFHAMEVAENLRLELIFDAPSPFPFRVAS